MLYLIAVVLLGIRSARGSRGATGFLLGGRDVAWPMVLFSIVATETSTVTFLSVPGLAFAGDFTFLQLAFGFLVGRLVVVFLLLPAYFRGATVTSYEVLGQRFGPGLQRAASLLFLVTRTLADGLRLYLAALVLGKLTGWGLTGCVLSVGGATILYTVLGGMRAVVWTDSVQFFVYLGGAFLALAVIHQAVPEGLGGAARAAAAAGKLRMIDLAPRFDQPYVLLAGLVGGAVLTLGTHGTDQLMVQRYLCARGQGPAALALGLSGVVVVLQFALFLFLGTALWFYFQHHGTAPARGDEVFATFLVEHLDRPPGARGLLLGAIFAVTMSTLSSSLHSSAAAAVRDFGVWRGESDEGRALRRARLAAVLFGVQQMAVAVGGARLDQSVVSGVLAIAGFTTGVVLGVFLLGRTRRGDARGAALGLGAGVLVTSVVCFATPLAWPWFACVGGGTTLAVGWLTSRPAHPAGAR